MASDLLRIRHEYSEESEQRQFFLSNLSQQFRSYYISKGSPTAQYYDHWETPDSDNDSKALLIDPDISDPNDKKIISKIMMMKFLKDIISHKKLHL